MIGHDAINFGFEIGEEWEPDASSLSVPLLECLVVGESVVVEEETGRDVERHKYVDGVVLVCGQDEEDAKHVDDPRTSVQPVHLPWGI